MSATKELLRVQSSFQQMLTNALSHERLTPVNSIVNLSEMLRKKISSITEDLKKHKDLPIQQNYDL